MGRVTQSQARQWAISKGYNISPRGNLPKALVERYNAEHPEKPYVTPDFGRPVLPPARSRARNFPED